MEEGSVDQLLNMLETEEQKGALQEFISRIGKEHEVHRVTGALVDSYIAEIDKALSSQMDEILHNEEFKALESSWRGLHFLVQSTEFSKPVKIELLDVSKEELFEDLEEAVGGEGYEKDSALWHHIYWNAYDKVGGHPYTAIVSDFQFDNSAQDIKMLRHVSVLSEMAQIPFLGNASAKFFGGKDYSEVMNNRFLSDIINEDAKYFTLTKV